MHILNKPLSKEEIKQLADENCSIEVVIKMSIEDLIDNDREEFLDSIAEKVVKDIRFMDIHYKVVGAVGEQILLEVSGDVSAILDEMDQEEEAQTFEVAKYIRVGEEFGMSENDVKIYTNILFMELHDVPKVSAIHHPDGTLYVVSPENQQE